MPEVTIPSADGGRFAAYLSLPVDGGTKRPGVVMMQQIFGVNSEMRSLTDYYASQGYIAICPDLFWRLEPGVQIDPIARTEFAKAIDLVNRLDVDRAVDDLNATVAFLRAHSLCTGKVGTIGYCLGGLFAFLLAARSDTEANISYFGVDIEKHLGEAPRVAKPLMLHIPEADRQVPPEVQARIKQQLAGRAELHSYPGADHAFNRAGAKTYDAAVTAIADNRTKDFLRKYLGA
jgi:carboxymethylenebutenolidase